MPSPNPPGGALAPPPPPAAAQSVLPLQYEAEGRPTRFRWVVLAMVFFAITINYIDRMVMGILAPGLSDQFNISKTQYGYITAAFGLSYALGQAVSGRWLDWIGTRIGYAVALVSWSVASMLHALAGGALSFGIARALLGVTESPAYPAANKTLAEWFPKRERALAMGFANAGANVGAIAAPAIIPWLAINFGWQWAFIISGAVGLVWILFWIPLYRRPELHPKVNAAELAIINSDPPETTGKVRWARLLGYRQTWAFICGKALTDPIWSFYLFWFPTFLRDKHGVQLSGVALPLVVIYVMADVGSIGGGWLSSHLIKRGYTVNVARKVTLFVCALCVVPAAFVSTIDSMWGAVLIVGVALSAHQGFSSNLYTLVSDMFPRRAVGSVSGLGGTGGYLGTTVFMLFVGWVLDLKGATYLSVFIACASAYLVAFLLIHLLAPKLEQADFPDEDDKTGPTDGFAVAKA